MCLPLKTYPLTRVFDLGTLTASKALTFKVPFGTQILGMSFQGGADFAANDSNYVKFGAINKGVAGAGTGVIVDIADAANSTKATGGTGVTAFTPNPMTVLTASSVNKLIANETVEVTLTVTGTVSIVDSVFIVTYSDPRRA